MKEYKYTIDGKEYKVALDKDINVETVSGTYTGRAAGIDGKGALLLAVEDKLISLNTGHITYNLPENEE